jgi:NADH-quinone oxidoreductase subunit J
VELILFLITAAIALVGAIAMLTSRNAVHSALFLLLNFAALAVLFLLLRAPFLFAIQLSIYAGAIMVLFLFVVMMLGAERSESEEQSTIPWQSPLALALSLVLLIEMVVISIQGHIGMVPLSDEQMQTAAANGSPVLIGEILFTRYLLPFEVVGVILLVAIVGVVVLNRGKQQAAEMATETATKLIDEREASVHTIQKEALQTD